MTKMLKGVEEIAESKVLRRMVWRAVQQVFRHGHSQYADDAMSLVLERLVKHGDFPDSRSVMPWLRRAIYSSVVDLARSEGRHQAGNISIDQMLVFFEGEEAVPAEGDIPLLQHDPYIAIDRQFAVESILDDVRSVHTSQSTEDAIAWMSGEECGDLNSKLRSATHRVRGMVKDRNKIEDVL